MPKKLDLNGLMLLDERARASAVSDAQMRCNEVEREAQLQLTVVRQSLGQVPDNIGSLVADLRATSVRLRNELTSAASSQDGEATRLRDVLEQVNVLIGSFNKFSGNLPRTLHEIITRLAEARAGRFWRTAQWYGDNLERQEILSLRVANLLRRPEQSLAQGKLGEVYGEVDECVRRSEIFRLKDRCAKMVFLPRVDEIVRLALARNWKVDQALQEVQKLRLNPNPREWQVAFNIRNGWTLWGKTQLGDIGRAHVTISPNSIKRPAKVVSAYTNGQDLRDDLFTLPNYMMEVHATLEIVVTTTGVGGDGHPHIYFSGKDLYWGKLGDYYWKPGMSDTEVNKRVTAARRAVQKLMDEYKGHLTALCDGILKHIRQGQDVCGNSYAP